MDLQQNISPLSWMKPEDLSMLIETGEQQITRLAQQNRLSSYRPYPKQREFHRLGATRRERALIAANQVGKTIAGGYEAAIHATGRYPDWWQGKKFDRHTVGWVAGVTGESTRDNPQRVLFGRTGALGTGAVPFECIGKIYPARGVADLMDMVEVKHTSGHWSMIALKSYEKGREKWQGETLDYVWFDEEPPIDIYTEGLTRTNVGTSLVWLTATPLLGMSETIRRFLMEPSGDRASINMTIDDAEHFSLDQRAAIVASYPRHEREARTRGTPALGSGRIFPLAEEDIACDPLAEIPRHWPRIGAMDFGWDHPFAAVELAWDRDTDRVYVTKCHRVREATPVIHAAALRAWGAWLPWAWPRDGRRETLEGAGIALANQYRACDLKMTPSHAQFEDGSVSVEAGLMDMLDRMQTGRLRVYRHLAEWFEEFRLYHRQNGKVVKEADDLMAATRYGLMMLRAAQLEPRAVQPGERRQFEGSWMA